jgi:hypothetical protein
VIKLNDVKQYFLGEGIDIALGIDRPKEEQKFYFDDEPLITLHSISDYVMLGIVTKDDNTSRQILLTPEQAKDLAKLLSKYLKKYAKKIKKG